MDREQVAQFWEGNAQTWTRQVRAGYDIYRDKLNTPSFLSTLPDVRGHSGLDVGCGEGANTRSIARLGAKMTGVDIAPTFIEHAREAEKMGALGIDYIIADAAELPFADKTFEFATSFMALMDMPDQAAVLREIARVLRPSGFCQFSILHPCFVPPARRNVRNESGKVVAVEVADYFAATDGKVEEWWFTTTSAQERKSLAPFKVPRFHRTLSKWIDFVVGAGLILEKLHEPVADDDLAKSTPMLADTQIAPIFLHFRVRKPAA